MLKPIMEGATVFLIDDPLNDTKAALWFNGRDGAALLLMARLSDPASCREIPLDELRAHFDGPGRAMTPELAELIVNKLDSLKGGA